MSHRLRTLLPTLALAAAVAALCIVVPVVVLLAGIPRSAKAAMRPPARPHYAPRVRRLRPKPEQTLGQRAADIALREVGVPYRWGGASPASGFDCSGLVYWTYRKLGIALPHSSYALYDRGRAVARSHMEPGDVLFFDGNGHVGLYIGRGRMVHAPHSGLDVQVVSLATTSYGRRHDGARRITPS